MSIRFTVPIKVENVKFLGVLIYQNPTWNQHVRPMLITLNYPIPVAYCTLEMKKHNYTAHNILQLIYSSPFLSLWNHCLGFLLMLQTSQTEEEEKDNRPKNY